MAKQKDFDKFLKNIEPSKSTIDYISGVQTNLRNYLKSHNSYSKIHVDTFLSGSYAKHTAIRPAKSDKKRDVDIIVVIAYDSDKNSGDVLEELREVLRKSSTYDTAKIQHHSVGIEMGQISIDVVPVIQDSEDAEVYYIGDSEECNWTITDPKGHKQWSTTINQDNNEKYKPLVKIFKWWRRANCPEDVKYPKGITLEKLIADNIGDSSGSTEDLLIETFENIVTAYKESYTDIGLIPTLVDPSDKIDGNDLLKGYTADDFRKFIEKIDEHLKLLNEEGTENDTWRIILGTEFPKETSAKSAYNLIVCEKAVHRQPMPWPFSRGNAAFIKLVVRDKNSHIVEYESNGQPLPKDYSLCFQASTGTKPPYTVKWQITNTGEEARQAECLRGNFENSDDGKNTKHETTSYTGSHSVQCFIVKNGICVAKSNPYIINIE